MLSEWLKLQKLTQADVVRDTGLSPNAVNRMYHNNFDRIDCKTALTLCEYLNCDFDLLFVLESDQRLRGSAFRQSRDLHPNSYAARFRGVIEKGITEVEENLERHKSQYRKLMESEIKRYMDECWEQHEQLIQVTLDKCRGLIERAKGASDSIIYLLEDGQHNIRVAKDLEDSTTPGN